ncbi:unnamed protein product [Symbiodinium natans]|uniref:Uncharacterized protein n=1 Tax=Symbiodinium natans TaxID=878477 RepID=A0A812MJ68_9DINO|nr:unnamed protein product [Symbiodinium natans]
MEMIAAMICSLNPGWSASAIGRQWLATRLLAGYRQSSFVSVGTSSTPAPQAQGLTWFYVHPGESWLTIAGQDCQSPDQSGQRNPLVTPESELEMPVERAMATPVLFTSGALPLELDLADARGDASEVRPSAVVASEVKAKPAAAHLAPERLERMRLFKELTFVTTCKAVGNVELSDPESTEERRCIAMCRIQAPPAYTLMMEYQDNALKIRALQEALEQQQRKADSEVPTCSCLPCLPLLGRALQKW